MMKKAAVLICLLLLLTACANSSDTTAKQTSDTSLTTQTSPTPNTTPATEAQPALEPNPVLPEAPNETPPSPDTSADLHTHAPTAEPATVDDPIAGYCGNLLTEVHLDGSDYSFCGSDSIRLTDILINLSYAEGQCRCMPEFTVDTEASGSYGVNLSQAYARNETGQAPLTQEQIDLIEAILQRNCQ